MYCMSRAGDPVADMENTFFQVEKREDGIAGEREENPVMEAVRSQFLVWFKKSGGIEWAENMEWPKGTSESKEREGASVHCIYQEKFLKKGAEAEMEEEYDLTHMMWNKRLLDCCWKG